MRVYVDATALIALGGVGRLELLEELDGDLGVFDRVAEEVTVEPAATNMETWLDSGGHRTAGDSVEVELPRAREVLDDPDENGDVYLVAAALADDDAAVVSDDRRVRTVCRGFGAKVTGTYGVVARAVAEGLPPEEAKEVVREIDRRSLHSTADLRQKVFETIEDASE